MLLNIFINDNKKNNFFEKVENVWVEFSSYYNMIKERLTKEHGFFFVSI